MTFDGTEYVLIVQELVAIRQQGLGHALGSIADSRNAIIAALDLLFTGF